MKPFSKSEWMTPAASGAFAPMRTVQARTSFGPAVKKLCRPSRWYAAWARVSRPECSSPMDSRYSAASSASRSASSASTSAQMGMAFWPWMVRSSCSWSSSQFATYRIGFMVRRNRSCAAARSSSVRSRVAARLPWLSQSWRRFATSRRGFISLSRFASFSSLGIERSSEPRSARMSSVWMVSTSAAGSTNSPVRPVSRMTLGSLKKRTTSQMASQLRMFAKNWLPRPSPSFAPLTRPAMSTNSTEAGTIFAGCTISASLFRRSSGTSTMPTLGSIVAKG